MLPSSNLIFFKASFADIKLIFVSLPDEVSLILFPSAISLSLFNCPRESEVACKDHHHFNICFETNPTKIISGQEVLQPHGSSQPMQSEFNGQFPVCSAPDVQVFISL